MMDALELAFELARNPKSQEFLEAVDQLYQLLLVNRSKFAYTPDLQALNN